MSESLIEYTIIIEGEPIPKARHRTAHKDKNGNALPYVIFYDTQKEKKKAYREAAFQYLSTNYPSRLFSFENCPLAMGVTYIMPVRKSWPKHKIRDLRRGMMFYHYKKPDLDNLIKFTKDALEGLCYKNDSQISIMDPPPLKIYGFEARTIIKIRTLPEFEDYT
ncbi:MAG TPA: hypothetical protein DDW42_10130 [Desulfobacteraceae bacterium]|nr:hypothetical protein [Desulfobacteraceae bacterium]